MILTFTRLRRTCVVAVVVAACACTRPSEDGSADAAARAGELLGLLKLVRQEYANAVAPGGGTVIDQTEYAETELFSEQAEAKVGALRAAGVQEERVQAIAGTVGRVRAGVTAKAPTAEVLAGATEGIELVEQLLAGATPEAVRGIVLATTRADQAIAAETIVGEYRVGVTSGVPRALFVRRDGALIAAPPPAAGDVYLGVVLRERRTKRLLPASDVRVTIAGAQGRTEGRLTELWGDFHQYGANVALPPDGPVTVTVTATPPAYARHGDMLHVFVQPVTATLQGQVRGGTLAFDARPVAPTDPDYAIGDDVLQATAEAGTLRDAGPYRVGVIVEGPEPVWPWTDGRPQLQPVDPAATNHVEVVLLDRETGQLVPSAHVTLTFLVDGKPAGTAALLPLLSVFTHYGQTLTLPPGATSVRVDVAPPDLGALDRPRLAGPVDIELPLPTQRGHAHAP